MSTPEQSQVQLHCIKKNFFVLENHSYKTDLVQQHKQDFIHTTHDSSVSPLSINMLQKSFIKIISFDQSTP